VTIANREVMPQQSCSAGRPSPWYETPAEIEAGLLWASGKRFLMRWVRRHMGRRCR